MRPAEPEHPAQNAKDLLPPMAGGTGALARPGTG